MPVPVTIDPDALKRSMVENGLTVADLADAADLSKKTVYAILGGRSTSLATAGRIYRSLTGDRAGFFAERAA